MLAGILIFVLFVAGVTVAITLVAFSAAQKKAQVNKPEILAEIFNGEKIRTHNAQYHPLPRTEIIEAAPQYGYTLKSTSGHVLVFEKD